MESLYFFAGIFILAVANLYAIARINKNSYLHTPIALPRMRRGPRVTRFDPEPNVELSPAQKRVHDYVERFAARQLQAIEKRSEAAEQASAAEQATAATERYEPTRRPHPQAVVGVAVMNGEPARNIDRWYRQAVGA